MNLIACIDEGSGVLFNHRRQSQDRVLRTQIVQHAIDAGKRLFMSPYTARQFRDGLPENAVVSDSFLSEAGCGDYCFVEDADPSMYADRIERLILFRWNREYPRDTLLPFDLTQWRLLSTRDFEGASHDRITEDVYVRCGPAAVPADCEPAACGPKAGWEQPGMEESTGSTGTEWTDTGTTLPDAQSD